MQLRLKDPPGAIQKDMVRGRTFPMRPSDANMRPMRNPIAALAPILALAIAGSGCAKPPMAEYGLVSTRPGAVHAVVVQRDVEGEACSNESLLAVLLRPPWQARLADHGRAVRNALAQVPTADVLENVQMEVRVEQFLLFQRICARVRGDAGRIE
jgi:hypothetical protein